LINEAQGKKERWLLEIKASSTGAAAVSIYRSVALSKCNEIHKLLPAGDSAAALPQVLGTASLRENDGDGDGAVAGAGPGPVTGCLFGRRRHIRRPSVPCARMIAGLWYVDVLCPRNAAHLRPSQSHALVVLFFPLFGSAGF
jgi:hypothetical protein